MHGLHAGAPMRRISLVGVFMLVMLALATHVSTASAAVTQTAITSPSDPSYFYDPTSGAQNSAGESYGGITVTGTTNSNDPSNDKIDIGCYFDDGSTLEQESTLVSGVKLNSSGGFTTTVPYSAIETDGINNASDAPTGECRLRAVPASPIALPTTGLSSFAGPRVLLADLTLTYSAGSPSVLDDYNLDVPQLGAVDSYTAALDSSGQENFGPNYDPYLCGLTMSLASTQDFGDTDYPSFKCADAFYDGYSNTGGIEVDGQWVYGSPSTGDPISVSVTEDPSSGDVTVHENEPLDVWSGQSFSYVDSGVTDERAIQQAGDGRVVLITDDFVSTDGASHEVDFDVSSNFDQSADELGGTDQFELPGQSAYSSPGAGGTLGVGPGLPGTIYSYNDTNSGGTYAGYDALTYFTAPSGPVSFDYNYAYNTLNNAASTAVIPFTLNVPGGGSQSLSIAYASEYSQTALAGDLQTELDLQTPPMVTISAPAAGATVSKSTVTVTGSVSAFTGVKAVSVNGVNATVSGGSFSAVVPLSSGSNTITAVVTTNTGITGSATESVTYTIPSPAGTPIVPVTPVTPVTPAVQGTAGATWLPIADTGGARRVNARKEQLHGSVTAGSGGVSYYFQYGTRGHLNHRSKVVALAAGKTSHNVALTIGGLKRGTRYAYQLVATGTYGHAAGRSRTFKTAAHNK